MAHYDDLNTQNLTVIGICGAVGTFVTVLGLQVMYHHFESREAARKVLSVPETGAESVLTEQRARLAEMGWLNRDKQILAIPIEEAMSHVLSREQKALLQESGNAR